MSTGINLKDGSIKTIDTAAMNMKDIMGGDCNMYVTENKDEDKAILTIFGGIDLPDIYNHIFFALDELSRKYPILEININTPGGAMITLIELLDKIELFEHVITIGRGEVCSAGFLLWMKGHTRVASPYTTFMIHRESGGSGGIKTPEAMDMYTNVDNSYSKMYEEFLGDLELTEIELAKIKMSELWYTTDALIEKGVCISKEDYIKLPNAVGVDNILTIAGKSYKFEAMFGKWVEVKVELVKYENPNKDVEDTEDGPSELINIVDSITSLVYTKPGEDIEEEVIEEENSEETSENVPTDIPQKDDAGNEDGEATEAIEIELEEGEVTQGVLFPDLMDVKELGSELLDKTKELVKDFMKKD